MASERLRALLVERRVTTAKLAEDDDPAQLDLPCRRSTVRSLVPSVNVVVVNNAGEILMIRRAAVRGTREESGIECELTGIVGGYADPKHVLLRTSNGEVRQEFSIAGTARPLSGQPTPGSESSQVRRAPMSELLDCTMDPSTRIRVNRHLDRRESPVII